MLAIRFKRNELDEQKDMCMFVVVGQHNYLRKKLLKRQKQYFQTLRLLSMLFLNVLLILFY